MENKIIFSVIAPAIRRDLYKTCYESIKRSRISFEVIFVGYNPPTEEMPSNFKYIYTQVNPAQCVEIAVRNATGEYIIYISDDLVFPDRFLDRIYYYISKLHMEKVLIGNRLQTDGVFYDGILTFDKRRCPNSPVVPWMPALKREIWMNLGGIDRRFSGALCDLDMILRFYETGYTPFIIPDNWGNEIKNGIIFSLCKKTEELGRVLNNRFWVKDTMVVKNRLEPVISFSDKDILTVDQFLK